MAIVTHCAVDGLLCKFVQLLDAFAVYVDVSRFAEDSDKSGLIHLAGNNLRCKRECCD